MIACTHPRDSRGPLCLHCRRRLSDPQAHWLAVCVEAAAQGLSLVLEPPTGLSVADAEALALATGAKMAGDRQGSLF